MQRHRRHSLRFRRVTYELRTSPAQQAEDTRLDLGEMRDSGNPQLLSLRIRVSPHLSWLRFGYVILSSVG